MGLGSAACFAESANFGGFRDQNSHRSIYQSLIHSSHPDINQPMAHSTSQSMKPSMNQSLTYSLNQSMKPSINQSLTPLFTQPINPLINRSTWQQLNQLTKQNHISTNKSIQPGNQQSILPSNQSFNEMINLFINQLCFAH